MRVWTQVLLSVFDGNPFAMGKGSCVSGWLEREAEGKCISALLSSLDGAIEQLSLVTVFLGSNWRCSRPRRRRIRELFTGVGASTSVAGQLKE